MKKLDNPTTTIEETKFEKNDGSKYDKCTNGPGHRHSQDEIGQKGGDAEEREVFEKTKDGQAVHVRA